VRWRGEGQQLSSAGIASPASSQPGGSTAQQGLVSLGDIVCTDAQVITPSGTVPLGQVTWAFADMSRTTRAIPVWAIVCAVLFFVFCFLGLLFLLAKEDRTEGWVQVVVQSPGFVHTVNLPVASVAQVADYSARVNYARSLSAWASRRRLGE